MKGFFVLIWDLLLFLYIVFVLGIIQVIGYLGYLLFFNNNIGYISWHSYRMKTCSEYRREVKYCLKISRLDLIEYVIEKSVFSYMGKMIDKKINFN